MNCRVAYNATFQERFTILLGKDDNRKEFDYVVNLIKSDIVAHKNRRLPVTDGFVKDLPSSFSFFTKLDDLYCTTNEFVCSVYLVCVYIMKLEILKDSPWTLQSNISIFIRVKNTVTWKQYVNMDLNSMYARGAFPKLSTPFSDLMSTADKYKIGTADVRYKVIGKLYTVLGREPTLLEIEGKKELPPFGPTIAVQNFTVVVNETPLESIVKTGYVMFYEYQRTTSIVAKLDSIVYMLEDILEAYKVFCGITINTTYCPRFILGLLFDKMLSVEPTDVDYDSRVRWGISLSDEVSYILRTFYKKSCVLTNCDVVLHTHKLEGEMMPPSSLYTKYRFEFDCPAGFLLGSYVGLSHELDIKLTRELVSAFLLDEQNNYLPQRNSDTALIIILTWLIMYRTNVEVVDKRPLDLNFSFGFGSSVYSISMRGVEACFRKNREIYRNIFNLERAWASKRAHAALDIIKYAGYDTGLWRYLKVPVEMKFDFVKGLAHCDSVDKLNLFRVLDYFDYNKSDPRWRFLPMAELAGIL